MSAQQNFPDLRAMKRARSFSIITILVGVAAWGLGEYARIDAISVLGAWGAGAGFAYFCGWCDGNRAQ